MTNNTLWGEIPEPRHKDRDENIPPEVVQNLILSAIKQELPKPKQPQPEENIDLPITIGEDFSTMEENVVYTIKLIKNSRQISELIRQANSTDEEVSTEVKDCPPMPPPPTRQIKYKESFPLRYVPREDSPFTLGEPITVPFLGKEVAKEILYKTVAALCAHAGFDTAMQSSLQVLTDIAEDFYRKFTRSLRYAVDREELYGNSGFPDAMERVFAEMGFGSMVCLHDFYQKRVLLYRDQCRERCENLMQQYETIRPNINREPEELIRVKTEIDNEEDIPELHFPAMADGDCGDEFQATLEPGLQMLHSLEQEVQLQSSMEQQEEGEGNLNDSFQSNESGQGPEAWLTAMNTKKRKKKI